MPRSRSFASLGLLMSGLLVSATCSGDVVGPAAGTEFAATRLDDQALPAVWGYDDDLEFSLLEDRIQFLGDRHYVNRTIHFQVRDLRNGVVTDEVRQGRWEAV